jgi:hypothetical protein
MNLQENIHRIKQMMGLNEELIGYKTANFALYAHLFSKLYDAYEKGNLEKEYSILMSDKNANKKMVKYFYNFIINNDKFFKDKEVFTESNIPNHIDEESISPEIFEDIINNFIINEKNLLVNHVVVHDVKVEHKNKYEHYILNVTVYVKEGSIVEGRFKDLGTNIKWNSFVNGLNQHKVFKKYL